ncbi:MAG: NHLP bacteriocin system secretion protein [Nostochopsis sp.]
MVTQKNNLFRKQALDHSSSPERLDQLMQVVSPTKWLPLIGLGILVASGLTWSVLGRVPITVEGKGVLIFPSKVVGFDFPSSGQLQTLNIRVGDFVKKGQVIGTIDQNELQAQILQQRAKLAQLQAQDQDANSLQDQRTQQQIITIAQQRQNLEVQLQQAQALTPILKSKNLGAIDQQRQNLLQNVRDAETLAPTLKLRLERRQGLKNEGAISDDAVLEAQQTYLNSLQKISELKQQLKQLDISQVQAQKSYLENLSQIDNFKTQLTELNAQQKSLAERNFQTSVTRKNQIQDLQRSIAQLQLQLKNNTQVTSNYTGRILELTVNPGQSLAPGTRLGTIDIQQTPSTKLQAVVFIPVNDGKKLQKGMKLQITPSTTERERFGGIVGAIADVSPFPITKAGAAKVVGNADIVNSLITAQPHIQVIAELQPDTSTFSGYKWSSSKGPEQKITSGTTSSVRVTVKEEAPISFVLPILKSIGGS